MYRHSITHNLTAPFFALWFWFDASAELPWVHADIALSKIIQFSIPFFRPDSKIYICPYHICTYIYIFEVTAIPGCYRNLTRFNFLGVIPQLFKCRDAAVLQVRLIVLHSLVLHFHIQ